MRPTWEFKSYLVRVGIAKPENYFDLCSVKVSLEESYIKTVIELIKAGAFPIIKYKRREWYMITSEELEKRGIKISMRELRPRLEPLGAQYRRVFVNYQKKWALIVPLKSEQAKMAVTAK